MKRSYTYLRYVALTAALVSFSLSNAQISIADGGTIDIDCATSTEFSDSNADGDNYAAGEMQSITICPGDGNATTLLIAPVESGHTWDVASSDFLFIYNGPNDGAPLLGTFNTNSHPDGFSLSTTLDNPSGCMTIVFVSSAGSTLGAGWTSSLFCGIQWQPFTTEISTPSENPDLPGYADICLGEEITLTCTGNYPFDGQGYEQSDATSFFSWDLGDGTMIEGEGLNSVTTTFPGQFGYFITCTVTDEQGQIEVAEFKVRISTTPNFLGTRPLPNDTICLGNEAEMRGGIAQDDISTFGFATTPSAFVGGGFFGEQQYLPDGNNNNYETTLDIDDFPAGAVIENPTDIVAVCINMEHSYLGDLEMSLECPDGTSINMFNSFTGDGLYPDGFGGGGTFLGNAYDNNQNNPGEGYTYCFTADAPWTLGDGLAAGNTEPSELEIDGTVVSSGTTMSPGNYLPEEPISNFIGCPINGPWTITVRDNLNIDDGYIFNWSVQFNPLIDPTAEFYVPGADSYSWSDNPTIISQNDTLITVLPPAVGQYDYTFNMIDDFGCAYDTTLNLEVIPNIDVSALSPACDLSADLIVENSVQGGIWTAELPTENTPSPMLPQGDGEIIVFEPGEYVLSYNDFFCQASDAITIEFLPQANADLPDTVLYCLDLEGAELRAPEQELNLNVSYQWTNFMSELVSTDPFFTTEAPGFYTLEVFDPACNSVASDVILAFPEICAIETYNVVTPDRSGLNDTFFIEDIEKFEDTELFVYNRWGNLIFEKVNYRNDWDMEDLADGTYFYVIKNPGRSEMFKGSFTVLK